jgi:hypothetical protein
MSIVPREVVAELWRKHYGKGSEQPYGQAQLFEICSRLMCRSHPRTDFPRGED